VPRLSIRVTLGLAIEQEGQSMIDDLRECGHINGLKVQTKEFLNQTMFQVSACGVRHLGHSW
jgi:hypothetical protein